MRRAISTAMIFPVVLMGCGDLSSGGSGTIAATAGTMELLRAGSPKLCTAGEVRQTLRELILPKLAALNGYDVGLEDKRAALESVQVSFENITLDSFDASVAKAKCRATASVTARGEEAGSAEEIEFVVSPSAEDDQRFIVSAGVSTLRTAAGEAVARILTGEVERRLADAEQVRTMQERTALLRIVSPRWLTGRWVDRDSGADACVDGPYEEYQAGGMFAGYESSGRWALRSLDLNVRGQAIDESFSADTTITAATADTFTETNSGGQESHRRRCTRDEMQPSEPPADEAAGDRIG